MVFAKFYSTQVLTVSNLVTKVDILQRISAKSVLPKVLDCSKKIKGIMYFVLEKIKIYAAIMIIQTANSPVYKENCFNTVKSLIYPRGYTNFSFLIGGVIVIICEGVTQV